MLYGLQDRIELQDRHIVALRAACGRQEATLSHLKLLTYAMIGIGFVPFMAFFVLLFIH